jgi:F-type H+-transporting ATPase subunit c
MKNKLIFLVTSLLAVTSPLLAQNPSGGPPPAHAPSEWGRFAAAYIAMGIASGLCGLGQGRATASAAEAMARNPGAIAAIRVALILGLVLIESLALYTLVITFIAK